MADEGRSLEFEIEVPGTPEEVWRAIATGPGISSWYVPHQVEERPDGSATARFGPEAEMEVPGRVAAWEPSKRIVFDGGEGVDGLAFEWTVEAKSGDTCIVRLVNSGFGHGDKPWDDYYDGMSGGWQMFLTNLGLHLEHFGGQSATALLPTGDWPGPPDAAWVRLLEALGVELAPAVGDRFETKVSDGPNLAGTVAWAPPRRLALVLDQPAPGTALLAVEGADDAERLQVSVWSYLYGPDRDDVAARDESRWRTWLDQVAPGPSLG